MGVAKLPASKRLDDFQFQATSINETPVRQWRAGTPLESARNLILARGTTA